MPECKLMIIQQTHPHTNWDAYLVLEFAVIPRGWGSTIHDKLINDECPDVSMLENTAKQKAFVIFMPKDTNTILH